MAVKLCILTYNRLKKLRHLVDNPFLWVGIDHLYLFSQASEDGTDEWILDFIKTHPDKPITFWNSWQNRMAIGGRQRIFDRMMADGIKPDDIIITLDDDVVCISPHWVQRLTQPIRDNPEIGASGVQGYFLRWGQGLFKLADIGECDVVNGGWTAYRGECFLKGIEIDQQYYPFWHADSDLAMQIRALGYKVVCVGSIGLAHEPHHHKQDELWWERRKTFADKWFKKGYTLFEQQEATSLPVIEAIKPNIEHRVIDHHIEQGIREKRPLRIVWDGRWFAVGPSITKRGIGRHSIDALKAVLEQDHYNQYILLMYDGFDREPAKELLNYSNVMSELMPYPQENDENNILLYQETLNQKLTDLKADVYHHPAPNTIMNLSPYHIDACPTVATLYDIIPDIFPEKYTPGEGYYRAQTFIANCDKVIAISECSKRDAVERLQISPDKIAVAYPGISDQFRRSNRSFTEVKTKFDLPDKFALCVSGLGHNKNLKNTLQAFGKHPDKLLAVVCHLTLWEVEQLERLAALYRANIKILGYVSDEELVALYNLAYVCIHPSVYEGFGLPPLEAMACGTPAIVSDSSSLPEVGGDQALYCQHDDIDSISEAIQDAWNFKDVDYKIWSKNCVKHARQFNYARLVETTLASYMEVAHAS